MEVCIRALRAQWCGYDHQCSIRARGAALCAVMAVAAASGSEAEDTVRRHHLAIVGGPPDGNTKVATAPNGQLLQLHMPTVCLTLRTSFVSCV